MDISTSIENGITIIKPESSRIDIGNSVEYRQKLTEILESTSTEINFDLSKVDFIDSSGIGLLIRFWQATQDKNILLNITHCSPRVLEALKVAHLDTQLNII